MCVLGGSLVARGDTAVTGDGRVIENPTSNGDLKLRVNVGGTKTDVLTVKGSTGVVTVPLGTTETVTDNVSTGTINNLAWTSPVVTLSGGSAVTLSGVACPGGATCVSPTNDGLKLTLVTLGSTTFTFKDEGSGSTSGNRFRLGVAQQDVILPVLGNISFVYANNRWRPVNFSDYAEGTWTPVFHALTGTDPAVTFATNGQRGAWVRNGKNFCFQTQMSWTAFTNGSGGAGAVIVITGLPYTAAGAAATRSAGAVGITLVDIPLNYNSVIWRIGSGDNFFTLRFNGDNIDDSDVTAAQINTFSPAGTKSMTFSGCFGI